MTMRIATCSCRQLRLTCVGEPVRVSICHCLDCQRRTGSVFGVQARFARAAVTIAGEATAWTRRGDSGEPSVQYFCPVCGSMVYWEPAGMSDFVGVAVGNFADPDFPPPEVSVYGDRAHPWALAAGTLPLDHH